MEKKQIKVAINGAAGRMGRIISEVIDRREDMIITHAYDRPDSTDITKHLCEISSSQSQVIVEPSSMIGEGRFDVLIDFSTPTSVINAVQHCLQAERPMVIGVTGFSETQKEELQTSAKEIPILMSPNMSIGVNLCFDLLARVAQTDWGKNAQVEIVETHHRNKKDKPSGTALRMGEIIAEKKDVDLSDIPMKSYREGEIMGEHKVFFSTNNECIELRHEAMDRSPFANGAVHAAWWIVNTKPKPGRIYTMNDVIGTSNEA